MRLRSADELASLTMLRSADNESDRTLAVTVVPGSQSRIATSNARSSDEQLEPRADQAEVEQKANAWAKLWNELAQYDAPDFTDADDDKLTPITVDMLRKSAASFPKGTGLGADNISTWRGSLDAAPSGL